MYTMGQHATAAPPSFRFIRSRQLSSTISSQSPPSQLAFFHPPHEHYRQHSSHSVTPSAAPAAPAVVIAGAGLVCPRQKLQCRGRASYPSRRLPKTTACCSRPLSCGSPRSCATSSSGLSKLWIPESTHTPFGLKRKMSQNRLHLRKAAADEDIGVDGNLIRTRKVVEHIVLFKMKDSLTEEQEKEMLDNLWSLQYQIKNVLCTSVGRLAQKTPEGYTHALFSRFPNKQACDEYMESTIRWRVEQDLVIPYFDGKLVVDFEGEVEDDIETIFRRGDDFQEGVEHFMLFRFKDNATSGAVDKFLKTATFLPAKFGELVQLTVGANLDNQSKGIYSHGLVARLPSEGAHGEFEIYLQAEPNWVEAMDLFETSKTIITNFVVSPVGKTVM